MFAKFSSVVGSMRQQLRLFGIDSGKMAVMVSLRCRIGATSVMHATILVVGGRADSLVSRSVV